MAMIGECIIYRGGATMFDDSGFGGDSMFDINHDGHRDAFLFTPSIGEADYNHSARAKRVVCGARADLRTE